MKKFSLVSLFVVLALVLAACGGGAANDATPGADGALATDSGLGMETEDVGGGAGLETEEVGGLETEAVATEDVSGGVDATQVAPDAGATDVAGTPGASEGPSIPNTGAQVGEFAHLDQLMDMGLMDSNGESLGDIDDFVLNVIDGRVDYLVVNRGGESILVPWSTLAFDRDNSTGFNFNGNLDAFNSVPVFSADGIDFMDQDWDADIIDAWQNPAAAATGQPGDAGAAGTAEPTQDAGAGQGDMSATQQSTQESSDEGLDDGPAFTNNVYAVLYSELLNMNVVERAGASDAQNNAGAGDQGSAQSTGEANATPVATDQSGQSGQGNQAGQGQNNTFEEGDSVGQVVGAIVNVTTGDLPYLVLSADMVGQSDNQGQGGANATQEPGAAQATSTVDSNAGSGSNMGSGSDAGFSNFEDGVLVPFRFFRFIDEDTVAVTFAGSVLQNAPVFSADQFPGPWNFGWDNTFGTFWQQNGNVEGANP